MRTISIGRILTERLVDILDLYRYYKKHYLPYAPMTDLFQALIEDRWISDDVYLNEKILEILKEYKR